MLRQSSVGRPTPLLPFDAAVRRLRLGTGELRLRPNFQSGDERLSRSSGMSRPEVPLSGPPARVDGQVARRHTWRSTRGGGNDRRRDDVGWIVSIQLLFVYGIRHAFNSTLVRLLQRRERISLCRRHARSSDTNMRTE